MLTKYDSNVNHIVKDKNDKFRALLDKLDEQMKRYDKRISEMEYASLRMVVKDLKKGRGKVGNRVVGNRRVISKKQTETEVEATVDEDKEDFMKHLEDVKNGDDRTAKDNIERMQKRLDIIKSGNVDWKEFDIDDEEAPNIQFKPDEFHDFSDYFIKNMKSSGISNHIIYNLGKDNEKVVDEIISKLT